MNGTQRRELQIGPGTLKVKPYLQPVPSYRQTIQTVIEPKINLIAGDVYGEEHFSLER